MDLQAATWRHLREKPMDKSHVNLYEYTRFDTDHISYSGFRAKLFIFKSPVVPRCFFQFAPAAVSLDALGTPE